MKFLKKLVGDKCYLSPVDDILADKVAQWSNDLRVSLRTGDISDMITVDAQREYLNSMNDVMNDVRNGSVEETYPVLIANNRGAQVIYDNIKEDVYEPISSKIEEEQSEYIVSNTSLEFDEIIKGYAAKPDWTTNTDIHNKISQDLEEKLWDLEDEYGIQLDTDKILEKTLTISIRKYGR